MPSPDSGGRFDVGGYLGWARNLARVVNNRAGSPPRGGATGRGSGPGPQAGKSPAAGANTTAPVIPIDQLGMSDADRILANLAAAGKKAKAQKKAKRKRRRAARSRLAQRAVAGMALRTGAILNPLAALYFTYELGSIAADVVEKWQLNRIEKQIAEFDRAAIERRKPAFGPPRRRTDPRRAKATALVSAATALAARAKLPARPSTIPGGGPAKAAKPVPAVKQPAIGRIVISQPFPKGVPAATVPVPRPTPKTPSNPLYEWLKKQGDPKALGEKVVELSRTWNPQVWQHTGLNKQRAGKQTVSDSPLTQELTATSVTPAMQALTGLNLAGVGSPPTSRNSCKCGPKKKRAPRKPRTECYRGSFVETASGTRKVKKERVPCQ